MSENLQMKKRALTRRQFLGIAWLGALGVLGVETLVIVMKFLQPSKASGFGGLIYAGKVEEFSVNSVNYIMKGRCYVVRKPDGFLTLWQKCTHLGCAVPWVQSENQFHCPCHGSLYNDVGVVIGGPAPRPLDMFPTTIKGGEVWVDTSKPTERVTYVPSQLTGA